MASDNPLKWRGVSRSSLQGRLYHALGHGQTQAFFEQLLAVYGEEGRALARHIAADDPAGLRATALAKVEDLAVYGTWGTPAQAEGHCAAQVWNLGAGVVYALGWARACPDSLRSLRALHGWVHRSEAA